jgi:hypothetical protein
MISRSAPFVIITAALHVIGSAIQAGREGLLVVNSVHNKQPRGKVAADSNNKSPFVIK